MTTAALICDTGALLDYLVASAPDHRAFRDAIDQSRTPYVPGLLLAEVDYFLRKERKAMGALIHDLSRRAFTYAAPTQTFWTEPWTSIASTPTSASASLTLRWWPWPRSWASTAWPTRDVRHLSAVRARGGKRLDLVVHPDRPDRGG